jgi:hypothetical protein
MFAVLSWSDFWMGVLTAAVSTGLLALIALVFRQGLKPTLGALATAYNLYFVLSTIRMTRFTRCRADYDRFGREAKSVDAYIRQAKRTLTVVGINLVTGDKFHGVREAFEYLTERDQPVEIHISLLDFRNESLMEALAPALSMTAQELAQSIKSGLASLFTLRSKLSQKGQNHIHIHAHCSIPFASAIIIDEKEQFGLIQIETKAYKAPLDESWGFELKRGTSHKMFEVLVSSYNQLIHDGVELSFNGESKIMAKQ